MPGDSTNIYQKARLHAGMTQERAAEALNVSPRSIKDYETDARRPPAAVVREMARAYGSPGLRLEHARDTDELGMIPRSARPRPLAQAVLRLYNGLRGLRGSGPRLAEIAEDGAVDASEEVDLSAIQRQIAEVVAACLELQCVEAQKGDRPELEGSKRSERSIKLRSTEDHVSIIPDREEMSSAITAGKAVSLT